jgi:hypothetical protein
VAVSQALAAHDLKRELQLAQPLVITKNTWNTTVVTVFAGYA